MSEGSTPNVVWRTLTAFLGDGCPMMAAATSYYTVFSLPPLLVLLMLLAGLFVDPATARELLGTQVGSLLGPDGAEQVQALLQNARSPEMSGLAATLGIVGFLLGATAVFAQLQTALNAVWAVQADPTRGDVKNFLLMRALSFAMILAIGFLLLVSLVVSALLAAFGDLVLGFAPDGVSRPLLQGLNALLSLAIITLLFAAMFRWIPDAVVAWRDALLGGAVTAGLFTLGKLLLGLYLGNSPVASAYGAAGSLALVLLWIYYSAMILLLGAEFTQAWAERRGVGIRPTPGAARVIRRAERVEPSGSHAA